MRLIDADEHKGKVICNHNFSGVKKLINIDDVPTAYDIDKVVEDLEKLSNNIHLQYENNYAQGMSDSIEEAIKIVKHGGVSDDVCEWRMDNVGASIGCRSDLYHTGYVKLDNCPYCGKKIKVVE